MLDHWHEKEDHTDEPEQQLSRSLSRLETQDIKTQPQFNHDLDFFSPAGSSLDCHETQLLVHPKGQTEDHTDEPEQQLQETSRDPVNEG